MSPVVPGLTHGHGKAWVVGTKGVNTLVAKNNFHIDTVTILVCHPLFGTATGLVPLNILWSPVCRVSLELPGPITFGDNERLTVFHFQTRQSLQVLRCDARFHPVFRLIRVAVG